MDRFGKILLVLVFSLALVCNMAPAKKVRHHRKPQSKIAAITNITCLNGGRYTRVIINLDKMPVYSHGFIPADEEQKQLSRVYLDLARTELSPAYKNNLEFPYGPLVALRFGQQPDHGLRLVLDLLSYQQYKVTTHGDNGLAIDLYDISPETASGANQDLLENDEDLPEPQIPQKDTYLIVIDPGHGGDDTGAVGPTGLQEKNVVLELALALRSELLRDNNIDVLLTRQQDRELQLKERTNFANHHQADLFISIHSNASTERGVGGFSTYYLNNTDDRFSQRLAAVENSAAPEELPPAELIVNYLKMNKTTISSQQLATAIQTAALPAISSEEIPIKDHGVLTALFYVLLGAKMPAVLVECNFISNPTEETLLADEKYRQKLVSGIANGIREYLKNH